VAHFPFLPLFSFTTKNNVYIWLVYKQFVCLTLNAVVDCFTA